MPSSARCATRSHVKFTVKTRIGFDSPEVFDELLPIFAKHSLDLLTVHGRTVKEMYRSEVHYDYIARAVAAMPCPVLANGNVHSAEKADEVLKITGARGLMIGRGAIRNPWLFHQIREHRSGRRRLFRAGRDVLDYVRALYEAVCSPEVRESAQVQKMKKYMNYLGVGVESRGEFLHQIRRVTTKTDFFDICEAFLDHDQPMPLEPFALELQADRHHGRRPALARWTDLSISIGRFQRKRVRNMPHLVHPAVPQEHLHHVESGFDGWVLEPAQVIQRGPRQEPALAQVHRRRRTHPLLGRPGLDFGEYQAIPVAKDQIDLATVRLEIRGEKLEAAPAKIFLGGFFPKGAVTKVQRWGNPPPPCRYSPRAVHPSSLRPTLKPSNTPLPTAGIRPAVARL